jgi:heat-inducible transcriptional repressor
VRTKEPVGSKQLVGRYRLTFSPATVRSELARLADGGFLTQPHTSAGRIPTDLGYRFFVDTIEGPGRLPEGQERRLDSELSREPASLEDLLQRTSEVLSRLTHYAAAVLAPRLAPSRLRRIDVVSMGSRTAMVVLIADNGSVLQRMVTLEREISNREIDRAAADLNRELFDMRLADAKRRANELAESAAPRDRTLLTEIVQALEQMLRAEGRIFVGGVSNLAGEPEFERDTLQNLYSALESQTAVHRLLSEALGRPIIVRIGSEVALEAMRPCSVVMAGYTAAGGPGGTIGLIGPTRMDYQRAIAATAAVARRLATTLEAIAG